jgi:AraC family transcriptional regulator
VLPINPRGKWLGERNVVLSGRGTRYYVPDFEGCLSVKSVMSGTAVWKSENRRFTLNEECWLILNDRQQYTFKIDSFAPVTTFCLFFERGFIEDIYRAHITPVDRLLDSPQFDSTTNLTFFTRIEPLGTVMDALKRFRTELEGDPMSRTEWDQTFQQIGELLITGRSDVLKAISRVPALGSSTRQEVYRRLLRGRDFLLSSLSEAICLRDMASAACLSPSHFHRCFTQVFGETPHQYLTRNRLQKAARLLGQSNSSVTEVCLNTGFESLSSFSSLFRRHYGVPPSKISKIQ